MHEFSTKIGMYSGECFRPLSVGSHVARSELCERFAKNGIGIFGVLTEESIKGREVVCQRQRDKLGP